MFVLDLSEIVRTYHEIHKLRVKIEQDGTSLLLILRLRSQNSLKEGVVVTRSVEHELTNNIIVELTFILFFQFIGV